MQLILMGREQQWLFLNREARSELALARSELALVWGAEYHHLLMHGGSVQQWLLHWGNRGVVARCRGGHQQLLLGEVGVLITSSGEKCQWLSCWGMEAVPSQVCVEQSQLLLGKDRTSMAPSSGKCSIDGSFS